jgi:aminoglycoside phosphotransferase (APT) family kinase protein
VNVDERRSMPASDLEAFPVWTIDGDDVARRLRAGGLEVDHARPVYLRDKPGETVVVGYDLTKGGHHERGYLRWSADPKRAENDRHKGLAMAPAACRLGPGVIDIGDHATVRILPNDARLRRARWYLTPRKLKRSLGDLDHGGRILSGAATSVQVLSYKPERRVVARIDLGYRDGHRTSVLLRYSTRATASALAQTTEHLRRHGVATARPIAQLERDQVGIDEFLPGIDLRTASTGRTRPGLVDAVAEQIATLHRVPAPSGVVVRSRDGELTVAVRSLRWLCERGVADLDLVTKVCRLLVAASERAAITPPVLLHGDLHDGNVLVDPDAGGGPSARLIDLERVSIGEAEFDLGRLLATGIAGRVARREVSTDPRVVAEIVDGVVARRGRAGTGPPVLVFHVAMELVAAALTATRHLETIADPSLVDRLLGVALDVLQDPEAISELREPHSWLDNDRIPDPAPTTTPHSKPHGPHHSASTSRDVVLRTRPATRWPQVSDPTPPWMSNWPLAYPRATGAWTATSHRGWARLDPEHGIAHLIDPADDSKLPALASALHRGELVAYRAGRRAVVATGHGFVKVVRPARVARLVAIHEALAATSGAPAVPRVEAATEDGAIDLTIIHGRSLHDLIRRGADDGILAEGAATLAALHASTPPAVLEAGTPDTAARWVGVVGRAEPATASALAPVATHIDADVAAVTSQRAGTDPVIVHGDCHDKNLFLDPVGSGFIDLDGARLGLREEDVANLAIHVALRALQADELVEIALERRDVVIDAYARLAPLDRGVLAVLERAVWFRLACLYRFRSSGRQLVPTLRSLAAPAL